ncbi:hypothetical protein L6452_38573 [Arctium lappa]|uniref:Uncharacterized protein n=1 Tax=Arctium lappa TaxID=4217 RepID=A0ACB8XR26_ARCLA|nr:hypothetical protein L6452_38573 [Arctium lappa]
MLTMFFKLVPEIALNRVPLDWVSNLPGLSPYSNFRPGSQLSGLAVRILVSRECPSGFLSPGNAVQVPVSRKCSRVPVSWECPSRFPVSQIPVRSPPTQVLPTPVRISAMSRYLLPEFR